MKNLENKILICRKKQLTKYKNQICFFIVLFILSIIITLLFPALDKVKYISGPSLGTAFGIYFQYSMCKKYYVSISNKTIEFFTPGNKLTQIQVSQIQTMDVFNNFIEFYLKDGRFMRLIYNTFDDIQKQKIITAIKNLKTPNEQSAAI